VQGKVRCLQEVGRHQDIERCGPSQVPTRLGPKRFGPIPKGSARSISRVWQWRNECWTLGKRCRQPAPAPLLALPLPANPELANSTATCGRREQRRTTILSIVKLSVWAPQDKLRHLWALRFTIAETRGLAPCFPGPVFSPWCAEHVRQLEGESPFDNLMEVK